MFPIKDLNAEQRHGYILEKYVLNSEKSSFKRDIDVIRENHKFLWNEEEPVADSWEVRLARKYYDKLFKEYCISDLSRFKENKVALRWRTENEVVIGKGQFICGNRICPNKEELRSWEVNFGYLESGEKKNVLIKLRLCTDCSFKLNYRSKKREIKRYKETTKKRLKASKISKKLVNDKSDNVNNQLDVETVSIEKELKESNDECKESEKTNQTIAVETDIWKKPDKEVENVVREEEFEKYLEDLLL